MTHRWKETLDQRVLDLENRFRASTSKHVTMNAAADSSLPAEQLQSDRLRSDFITSRSAAFVCSPDQSLALNLSCSLGAFPASSVTVATSNNAASAEASQQTDLVSKKVIDLMTAETSFAFYKQHLDHYMHYELSIVDDVHIMRTRSALLTAAVCTVAAFCTGSGHYSRCVEALKIEVAGKLFAERQMVSPDDVRALCIGALWLSDLSSTLCGLGQAKFIPCPGIN
jgi:hypothetical protein